MTRNMIRNLQLRLLLPLLAISLLAGCHHNQSLPTVPVVHPKQLSTLDGQAYDALVTAQAALDEAKKQYANGGLPEYSKGVINAAGTAYNSTRDAWLIYRGVLDGTIFGDQSRAGQLLQQQLQSMTEAVQQLKVLLIGRPALPPAVAPPAALAPNSSEDEDGPGGAR